MSEVWSTELRVQWDLPFYFGGRIYNGDFCKREFGHVLAKSFIRSYGNVMAFKMMNSLAVFRGSLNECI